MATINADGNKLKECGEDIIDLCNQYNSKINDLFYKLSQIPVKAWSGDSANYYVSKVMSEKNIYINFGKKIMTYGSVIKNVGSNVNYIIAKWSDK